MSTRTVGYSLMYLVSQALSVSIQHPLLLTSYFHSHFYSDLSLLHIFFGAAFKKQWLILPFTH